MVIPFFVELTTLQWNVTERHVIEGRLWQFEEVYDPNESVTSLNVYRGNRLLQSTEPGFLRYKLFHWPYRGRLLAVCLHSGMGSGMFSRFYRIDRRGIKDLGIELEGEIGGPIFRDFDRDGRAEIVFDNWSWYTFRRDPPSEIHVYKYRQAKLRLWKALPNRQRIWVARVLPWSAPE